MPDVNVNFQGQTLIRPGAYYGDDVSGAIGSSLPPTPPLIFIGYGYGQKPLIAVNYTDPQSLLNAIRGGPASGFVDFMTDPSPQLSGAQSITFINVGENTQSSLAVADAAAAEVAVATSTNYGVPSNLLQMSVANGSTAGKMVTLYDGYSNVEQVGDNLGVPFELAYTGSASGGVTYSVATSGLTATAFSVSSPNSGESFTINIGPGEYETVEQIIEYLNGTGFYSAVAIGDGTMPATYLDAASGALAVPVSGVYQYSDVTAALGSVVYWMNQYAQSLATMVIASGVTGLTASLAPANIPLTPFTGARSIPPTNQDYANGFNVALTQPGFAVFADSNSAAVRALLAQHCITASEPVKGKWRRGFTGSNVGDSIATTVANAQSADAAQISYVYPGIYRTDTLSGLNVLHGGLYAAAAAAGMRCGNPAAIALTNKSLVGNGLELNVTDDELNQLQAAGVMCLGVPDQTGVPTIISDLTTWQTDANPENVFDQQVACRYYFAYSMVNAMQPYVGSTASPVTLTQVKNKVKKTLNLLLYKQGGTGVLASWDASSLTLSYNGQTQTLGISVSVQFVGQNRFITMFVPIEQLNLTLTSTQTASVAG